MRRAAVSAGAFSLPRYQQPNRGAAAPVAPRGPARVCFQPFDERPAHDGRAPERREVVVVGGSQAGLAIGYFFAQHGRDFTILDAADELAATWRERWESLRLFTSARYDALPGLAFPGDPNRYPSKDEVADYLTEYARSFDLPVELGSRVSSVSRINGTYLVELEDRAIEADQVVIATGPFQTAFVPPIAEGLGPEVVQMHSTAYRSPKQIPDGRVLVVGGGNTGYQIAEELSASREVHISIGSRAEAAPAAPPRPRPVLVPRQDRTDPQDKGHPDRPADAGQRRHADRLQPPRPASPRRRVPRTGPRRRGLDGEVQRRHRSWTSAR